jgi:hypothetical protein
LNNWLLSVHRVISQIKEKNDQKVAVTERVKYSCKNQNRQVLEDFSSAAIAVFALNSDGLRSNRNHIGKATVPLQYRAQTPTSSLVSQAIKKICRKKRKKEKKKGPCSGNPSRGLKCRLLWQTHHVLMPPFFLMVKIFCSVKHVSCLYYIPFVFVFYKYFKKNYFLN